MSTVELDPDGYSRLVDGDTATFWKSNPYQDATFTHEANALHPQWNILDLGSSRPVDGMTIAWANSYAVRYRVQYWRVTMPSTVQTRAPGGLSLPGR